MRSAPETKEDDDDPISTKLGWYQHLQEVQVPATRMHERSRVWIRISMEGTGDEGGWRQPDWRLRSGLAPSKGARGPKQGRLRLKLEAQPKMHILTQPDQNATS